MPHHGVPGQAEPFDRWIQNPNRLASLRGPCPPFRICPECGTQSETPWVNPILEGATKLGIYTGEITGGQCLCPTCEPIVEARLTKKESGPRVMRGCPQDFVTARIDFYLTNTRRGAMTAIEAAYRFLADDATHDLYLCGPVGVGKTRLACAIGNELAQRVSVQFIRVHALLLQLQENINSDVEHAQLTSYIEPAVLVLDDVGVDKGSDWRRSMLQTLYDQRRDVGRRTIWTSNLDLEALNKFLDDDRLPSRIAGAADVVWLDGDDLRVRPHAGTADPAAMGV